MGRDRTVCEGIDEDENLHLQHTTQKKNVRNVLCSLLLIKKKQLGPLPFLPKTKPLLATAFYHGRLTATIFR